MSSLQKVPQPHTIIEHITINTIVEVSVIVFIAIATILWKKQIYPTLKYIAQAIEKDREYKLLTEEKEVQIKQNLRGIIAHSGCDRVTLFLLHNSINFASGHSFLKFSAWVEVCKDDVEELLHHYRDVQYSIISDEINNIKNNLVSYICYNDSYTGKLPKSFITRRNMAAYGFYLIKKENKPLGFILIEYIHRLHCAIARNVERIVTGKTSDRCRIENMSDMQRISDIICD